MNILKLAGSPYVLLVFAVLFWSGNFIIGRATRADIPPIALAFWRWTMAGVIALILAKPHIKGDWPTIKRSIPILLFLSITGIASFNTLVYLGLQLTFAVNGLLMQSMIPVVIVALSFVIYREKITFIQVLGIGVSLVGVATIILHGDFAQLSDFSMNRGDIYIFIAVVSYGLYTVALRKRPLIHPMSFIATTFIMGVFLLFPFYLYELFNYEGYSVGVRGWIAIGYVGIFPSIVSYLCYNRGVELIGAPKAGMFIHLMPVFGSIMAIIFLGEKLMWFHVVGIGAIGCGIYLSNRFSTSR